MKKMLASNSIFLRLRTLLHIQHSLHCFCCQPICIFVKMNSLRFQRNRNIAAQVIGLKTGCVPPDRSKPAESYNRFPDIIKLKNMLKEPKSYAGYTFCGNQFKKGINGEKYFKIEVLDSFKELAVLTYKHMVAVLVQKDLGYLQRQRVWDRCHWSIVMVTMTISKHFQPV